MHNAQLKKNWAPPAFFILHFSSSVPVFITLLA